jgi:aspartokinase-like uncharacterized kinase
VKVGGGLLRAPGAFERVAEALGAVRHAPPMLVVPGGGPFADAVRAACRDTTVSDDAAHWMAILAMDQFAHLLSARVRGAALVDRRDAIEAALADRRLPVLAPYRWLREADPLPHSWDATSDSIAAWLVGILGARRLVLVKPAALAVAEAVDRYFAHALPQRVRPEVLAADDIARLGSLLSGEGEGPRG